MGGAWNYAGGWCRALDEVDFDRSHISEDLRWPISKSDLDPYLREACDLFEVPADFGDREPNAFGVQPIGFFFTQNLLFGDRYFDELSGSEGITLVLNANFVDVSVKDNRVISAEFKSYSRNSMSVRAKKFVFSMGGIENSRMLKWLHSLHGDAFFDGRMPVGNYWMEHPTFELGEAVVEAEVSDQRYFSTSADFQKENGVLNCGLMILGISHHQTSQLINDLLCIAPTLGQKLMDMADRKLVCGGKIKSAWEQLPVKSNRVELSTNETDRFGIPRPVVHWKKSEFDRNTVIKSLQAFNEWLMDSDLGRLRLYDWLLDGGPYPTDDVLGGHHHMGGTRMGEDPREAVVDKNCKVFGTENLYMAGSSVFTTGGHANPTLAIIQLTLRLSDHLLGV